MGLPSGFRWPWDILIGSSTCLFCWKRRTSGSADQRWMAHPRRSRGQTRTTRGANDRPRRTIGVSRALACYVGTPVVAHRHFNTCPQRARRTIANSSLIILDPPKAQTPPLPPPPPPLYRGGKQHQMTNRPRRIEQRAPTGHPSCASA
jgi:hypothetical protein